MHPKKSYPIVLSIAGSDSSGGAGIQADLKTFSALGVYGATAITAITAQNTRGVKAQLAIDSEMVRRQIEAVFEDLRPSVVKIGMLSNGEIVRTVVELLRTYSLPVILDPLIVSSSGHRLLSLEAQELLKRDLLPMATLLTPNIPEMEALTGMPLCGPEQKLEAARALMACGARAILLKGGHEEGELKSDLLFWSEGGELRSERFTSPTIPTRNIHGTGCTLSSAIAAYLARGLELRAAVAEAKRFISEAILSGAEVQIGEGFGPVNHGFNPLKMMIHVTE